MCVRDGDRVREAVRKSLRAPQVWYAEWGDGRARFGVTEQERDLESGVWFSQFEHTHTLHTAYYIFTV